MLSIQKIKLIFIAIFTSTSVFATEINVYSARKEALIKPILDTFTQQTGIKVNLVTAKADKLLKRLKSEGKNSPADLLITTDAGRLYRAKKAGVLRPVKSKVLEENIPIHLRDLENYWFGLSLRARPIFYVKGSFNPSRIKNYEDLAKKEWRKKICIRSSSNIYNQSLVASMIANIGKKKTQTWANGLVANFATKPKGGDRDQIKSAAAGVCSIAIANTYYFAKMLQSKDRQQREAAEKMAIIWPNQAGRGTHVNVSGVGLTKYSSHKTAAVRLMEYLASQKAQQWYASVNFEYPVLQGVSAHPILEQWVNFKSDSLNLSKLGAFNADALKIMDLSGWR